MVSVALEDRVSSFLSSELPRRQACPYGHKARGKKVHRKCQQAGEEELGTDREGAGLSCTLKTVGGGGEGAERTPAKAEGSKQPLCRAAPWSPARRARGEGQAISEMAPARAQASFQPQSLALARP